MSHLDFLSPTQSSGRGVTENEGKVLSLDVAALPHAFAKARDERIGLSFCRDPEDRVCSSRLLREGCERPRDRSRKHQEDLAPVHSTPSPSRFGAIMWDPATRLQYTALSCLL